MITPIHNLKPLLINRKALRNKGTPAEAFLWTMIKHSKLKGRKFRRQHSVGNYILDFYCPFERLAIELDGAHHFTDIGFQYDEERTKYINGLNIRVIRFENKDVFEHPENVLRMIADNFIKK